MKLELVTGIAFTDMVIEVYNNEGVMVCRLDDDARLLGSYPVVSGMRLHVSNCSEFHSCFTVSVLCILLTVGSFYAFY